MKIYHYTTIDSLAMIMSSRSIKFNRLDKVDDIEERVESASVKLWQYMFVSCWTENPEESIPLWRMYSGISHGVRIGLDIDMFEDNLIDKSNVPLGLQIEGSIKSKIPTQDIFDNEYTVMPITPQIDVQQPDSLFYCHVVYVDDVYEKTKNTCNINVSESMDVSSKIAFGEIGKYKNKRWDFQEETRFRLLVLPFNPYRCDPKLIPTIAVKAFQNNKPIPKSALYLKIKQKSLDNIEITLHPNVTQSDRVIVDALCAKYAKNAKVKESELVDRVVFK